MEAGVHHAVVNDIAVGHRRAQRVLVVQVAVAPLDVEVVDTHCLAGLPEIHPHIVATLGELAGDVGAYEATRTHDERFLPHL